MLTMTKFYDITNDVLAGEKQIFSLRENWNMFRPHLENPAVEYSLARCLDYNNAEEWKEDGEDAPWTYTPSDYWVTIITDNARADPQYKLDEKLLFESLFGVDADIEDDELWDDLYQTDAYPELDYRYFEKYEPKKGEIEWYQWVHGCFFIAPFVATLLQTAIEDAEGILILTSDTHSVAGFVRDNILFFADILIEWGSVEDLEKFMGELSEVKFLALDKVNGKVA
jgi:hypothetical protein